jgi:adenylate cyclase
VISQVVFLAVVGIREMGILQLAELPAYDQFLVWRPSTAAPDPRITLIGITDKDIQRWNWPLSDATLSDILDRLLADGARVIGLDIYRDRPVPPGQERLNALLAQHHQIIAVMKFGENGIPPPEVLKGTDRVGAADIVVDPGGTVRRGLLYLDDGRTSMPSFALQMALRYLESHGISPQQDSIHPEHLRLGKVTLPPFEPDDGPYVDADAQGYQLLLDFQGAPQLFRRFSLTDLLSGRVPVKDIQDKIVIVGIVSEGVKDLFFTPFSRGWLTQQWVFGVTLHAHITSQLLRMALDGSAPMRTLRESGEWAWIGLWSLLGGLTGFWARSAGRLAMAGTVGLLLLGLVCYLAFIEAWWLPLVPSALAFGIAATGVTASLSRQESMQRALLMQLFSKYVSRDFAEAIWQQREQFAVGGCPRPQQLVATVLFVDLRGFTAVSEKLEPQALIPWLNAFIDSMARLVMRHGGVAHQFIGDAVMAVFGVPLARTTRAEIAQDAANAVQCALAMTRQVDCLNARWREQGLPAMGIRIGICTGAVVVGSLGSEERLAYMVIGDTVNTASRLQSLDCSACPATSGRILIGESTLAYLEGQFTTQCIGAMRLKGKDKEIRACMETLQLIDF